MPYSRTEFPELRQDHVTYARLYANRRQMLKSLKIPRGGAICEVGVAQGDFSEFLLETLKPSKFFAIDLFEMEKYPIHWGVRQEIIFNGMTHFDFYRQRLAQFGDIMIFLRGLSRECLLTLPDQVFDMIYIDAGHLYEDVRADAELAQKKVKHDGILVFNDYIMYDPFIDCEYGVVQVVNEILDRGGWRIIGFALEKNMFCDVAIQRSDTQSKWWTPLSSLVRRYARSGARLSFPWISWLRLEITRVFAFIR